MNSTPTNHAVALLLHPHHAPAFAGRIVGSDLDLVFLAQLHRVFEYDANSTATDIQRPAGELFGTFAEDDAVGDFFARPATATPSGVNIPLDEPRGQG